MDAPTSSSSKQGHNSRTEKVVTSEIKFCPAFMVLDLVYKFQIICLTGTYIEQNPNMDVQTWEKTECSRCLTEGAKNTVLFIYLLLPRQISYLETSSSF